MGWDTHISILVEDVRDEQYDVAKFIYEDIKPFGFSRLLTKTKVSEDLNVLFVSYERRKYLPYWKIEEISVKYPFLYFTALGSTLDSLCGPAGIVKIANGKIIDSYGFWGKRQGILAVPNHTIIYE